jgi:hypothetical protein
MEMEMDVLSLLNVVFVVVLIALWWGLYDAAHPPPEAEHRDDDDAELRQQHSVAARELLITRLGRHAVISSGAVRSR